MPSIITAVTPSDVPTPIPIFAPALSSVDVGAGEIEGNIGVTPELADVKLGDDVVDATEGAENDVEAAAEGDEDDVEDAASSAEEELELERKQFSSLHSYPTGQLVEVPQPSISTVSWVVCIGLVGNAVALRRSRAHGMGDIISQFLPRGQHIADA